MRRLLLILFPLGVIMTALQSAKPADESRLKMYYGLAEGHFLTGNLSAAQKSLDEILRLDPSHNRALELQARILMEQGADPDRTQVTLHAIDESLATDTNPASPQSTDLRLARARLLARTSQAEAAIRELQSLTSQQPDHLEATLTLVALYAAADRWQSVEQLIPSITQQPTLADLALYLEGRTAYARGRIGRAREKFESALEKQPSRANRLSPSLYFYRSRCLEALDRPEEARLDLLKAFDSGFRPETTDEALRAARALLRHTEPDRALPILEGLILNQLTENIEAWNLLGRAHRLQGSTALALSAFNESLRLQPAQAKTLALRAGLLRQINDLEGALADYEKATALDPGNPALSYARGLTLLQLGQIPAAATQLEAAATQLPQQSEISLLAALLQFTTQDYSKARQILKRYFAVQSEPVTTAHQLAYLLDPETPTQAASDFTRYCEGALSRKDLLDTAGRANTTTAARQQIAATAFFMAHSPRAQANPQSVRELLEIAARSGSPTQPEALCARWLLRP
jgi:tetratricopeptide (TPR) repeat protein